MSYELHDAGTKPNLHFFGEASRIAAARNVRHKTIIGLVERTMDDNSTFRSTLTNGRIKHGIDRICRGCHDIHERLIAIARNAAITNFGFLNSFCLSESEECDHQ